MGKAALCGTLTRKEALDFLSFYMSLIADLKRLKVSTLVAPMAASPPRVKRPVAPGPTPAVARRFPCPAVWTPPRHQPIACLGDGVSRSKASFARAAGEIRCDD